LNVAKIFIKFIRSLLSKKSRSYLKNYFPRLFYIYLELGMGKRGHRSYSFDGEDMIIRSYFPEGVGGYIDVGSGSPIRGSNTYHFYKKGFSGICIDPLSLNHFAHKLIRPRDISLNNLCGNSKRSVKFYEFRPNEFSTSSHSLAKSLIRRGIPMVKSYKVKTKPLSQITRIYTVMEPFFLNIDTEGKDYEVLKSFNFANSRPRVICIEENKSPFRGQKSQVKRLLERKSYTLVSRTKYSNIYCCNYYLKTS
jgi:FkbM family methyltransferase